MSDRMRPETAIPPTALVRRFTAKRWHLQDGPTTGGYAKTYCDRTPIRVLGHSQSKTAYNAAEVDCTDCLTAAIRRHPRTGGR